MKTFGIIPDNIKQKIKRNIRQPFERDQKLIIHACYHKIGTVWFANVLKTIADFYGLNFQKCKPNKLKKETEIFFDDHSLLNPSTIENYLGSHMIRDPRDVIISGYFYHLKTKEDWAHEIKEEYDNKSYQEFLKSKKMDKGLLIEIRRASSEIIHMAQWNYNNPNFIEIKYEDIICDEQKYFKKIFVHYGFNQKAINKSLEISNRFSIRHLKWKKNSHIRSGKPREWEKYFSKEHKNYFKRLCGDSLIKLGYEKDNNW